MYQRGVIKNGTSSQEHERGVGLSDIEIGLSVSNNVHLRESGICGATVQIASGSVVAGLEVCEELGWDPQNFTTDQLARMGTGSQAVKYQKAAKRWGYGVTQVLISEEEIKIPKIRQRIAREISRDMQGLIIPLVNENETTGDKEAILWEEIHEAQDQAREDGLVANEPDDFENDRLAREVAGLVEADLLIYFTGTDGVLGKDANGDLKKVIETIHIDDIDDLISEIEVVKSENGSGGMRVKLKEAKQAAIEGNRNGLKRDVFIASYKRSAREVLLGDAACTRVVVQ